MFQKEPKWVADKGATCDNMKAQNGPDRSALTLQPGPDLSASLDPLHRTEEH